jgi:hypothetical protein
MYLVLQIAGGILLALIILYILAFLADAISTPTLSNAERSKIYRDMRWKRAWEKHGGYPKTLWGKVKFYIDVIG